MSSIRKGGKLIISIFSIYSLRPVLINAEEAVSQYKIAYR
jgi:hypothetical protein